MGGAPLSPALSPFVPHGARETGAPLDTPVPTRTFTTVDPAGGSNLRLETYTANDLNQYTQRTVPGFSSAVFPTHRTHRERPNPPAR